MQKVVGFNKAVTVLIYEQWAENLLWPGKDLHAHKRGNHQLVQMTTQLQNTWRAPSFLSIPSFPKLDLFNLEQREGVGFHLGIGYQALTPRHLESWTWLGVYADLHLNQDLEYWQSSQGLKWTHLHAQHIVNWDLTLSLPGGNSIGFCSTDISWKKWPKVSL